MTLELIANEAAKLHFDNTAGPTGITYNGDPGINQTPPPNISGYTSPKYRLANEKCLVDSVFGTFGTALGVCPFTTPGWTLVVGTFTMYGTTVPSKAGGLALIRKGDSAVCSGSWTDGTNAENCSCDVELSDAGQDKERAE